MCQCTPTPDAGISHHLTEDQHTALYRARHLIELIGLVANASDEFVDLRYESIAVTFGLLGDLMDEAVPDLVWRKKS